MGDEDLLKTALDLALRHLRTVHDRHVGGRARREDLLSALGGPLPERRADARLVLEEMAAAADPGIVSSPGPRYFGFVTGGAFPVAVAADWLTSAWDQNAALYVMSPAIAVMEDVVAGWILDFLGLPESASVGFVTGAHMANATCLAAARHEVLRRQGWNVEENGLANAPPLTVVTGDEVHVSVIGALRLLGIGARELVKIPADSQGRMRADALERTLANRPGPLIVCAQAGNVNTGASDPMAAIVAATHAHDGWVHVDGAFGLWAAGIPQLRDQVAGIDRADSWTTDAHKWLNVPYDSGLAIVAHPAPHRASMSLQASYLVRGADEERVGMDWVPESSRRARAIPIYAMLRTLGRSGLGERILHNCTLARRMASRLDRHPGIHVLNEIALNQVLVRFGRRHGNTDARSDTDRREADDRFTRAVIARVQDEGVCWVGGAVWHGQHVMRISISNWKTTEEDVDRSADAIIAAASSVQDLDDTRA